MRVLPTTLPLKKLSVWATIRETLEMSWRHRKVLAIWIVGCTIFTGGLCYLLEYIFTQLIWIFAGWKPIWIRVSFILLAALPTLMISVLFSIFCHRLILMDGEKGTLNPIAFGQREWRFLGWDLFFCGAGILIVLLALIVNFLALDIFEKVKEVYGHPLAKKTFLDLYLIEILVYGVGSCLLAPYCFVLPATAMDLRPSLAWSSEEAKGNELRLSLLFGGLPFVFGLLYCPPSLLTWLQIDQFMIVKHVIRPFLVYLVTPIIVIAISIAFRELTNWNPSTPPPEEAPVS